MHDRRKLHLDYLIASHAVDIEENLSFIKDILRYLENEEIADFERN